MSTDTDGTWARMPGPALELVDPTPISQELVIAVAHGLLDGDPRQRADKLEWGALVAGQHGQTQHVATLRERMRGREVQAFATSRVLVREALRLGWVPPTNTKGGGALNHPPRPAATPTGRGA